MNLDAITKVAHRLGLRARLADGAGSVRLVQTEPTDRERTLALLRPVDGCWAIGLPGAQEPELIRTPAQLEIWLGEWCGIDAPVAAPAPTVRYGLGGGAWAREG